MAWSGSSGGVDSPKATRFTPTWTARSGFGELTGQSLPATS